MTNTPTLIRAPATLAVLGGGQLGLYFVRAAQRLGYHVLVLDPDPRSPAGRVADEHLAADYDDLHALDRIAGLCAAVTTEFENVPADTLRHLAQHVPVSPSAQCVATAQDRIAEKNFFRQHGLPCVPYRAITGAADFNDVPASLFPAILKVSRLGYDGKGQARVADIAQARQAFEQFKGVACVLEKQVPLDGELSVILVRGRDGRIECFPVGENHHRHGILDMTIVPARLDRQYCESARDIACKLAEHLGYVGTLGVEFFVSEGKVFLNEIAPRPHNSGHYTLDACETDQFEQQVRALCGLPLGSTRAHSAAVMVNLLGDVWFEADGRGPREPDWARLLQRPNLKLHLYGKAHAKKGRKMGHFTVTDSNAEKALAAALDARAVIGIGE